MGHVDAAKRFMTAPGAGLARCRQGRLERQRLAAGAGARRLLNEMYPGRGRMLEVGARRGFLLGAFRQDGWRVEGVGEDPAMRDFMARHHGIAIAAGPLWAVDFAPLSFHVAILCDAPSAPGEGAALLGGHCLIDTPAGARAGGAAGWAAPRAAGLDPIADPGAWDRLAGWCRPGGAAGRPMWWQKRRHAADAAGTEDAGAEDAGAEDARAGDAGAEHIPAARDVRGGYAWRLPQPHGVLARRRRECCDGASTTERR
jgi:hypothetical protein